jgi:3'(2'), 5'-bisphosphate nucleotidase
MVVLQLRLQINLSGANPTPLTIPSISPTSLNFLESVEAAHSSHSFNDRVASLLGITRSPIRMDSQAKYGCLARGEGGAYLRMPTGVGYQEKIWVRLFRYMLTLRLSLMPSIRTMPQVPY